MTNVVVVGNGAVALMVARAFIARVADAHVTIVAPMARRGCASLAAAAMLNSFCEVEAGTAHNRFERCKWLFNRAAAPLWPEFLRSLEAETGHAINRGFGTFLINNHASDRLEDANFEAVLSALREHAEPHEVVAPRDIPHYKPSSHARAGRAVLIPHEGWLNPVDLLAALEAALQRSRRVTFTDAECVRMIVGGQGRIDRLDLSNGEAARGDVFVLAPGASFSRIAEASNLPIRFPRVLYGVGCTLLLATRDDTLSKCIRTPNRGLACGVYSAPRDAKHTIVGASNFISAVPCDHARATSVYTLLKAAMEQISTDFYRADVVSLNVGWRPTSEDTLPMIGRTDIENLLVATATKRDGVHCSPLIADCLVDLALGRPPRHDLALFKPDRAPVRLYERQEAIDTAVAHILNAAFQHDFVPAKNRMLEEMERYHREQIERLHDKVGAVDWGIPPEMLDMYRYGHV